MKTPIKTVTVAKLYLDQGYPLAAIRLLDELTQAPDAPEAAFTLLREAKEELKRQRAEASTHRADAVEAMPRELDVQAASNEKGFLSGGLFGSLRRVRHGIKAAALGIVELAAKQALRRLAHLIERIEENRRGF